MLNNLDVRLKINSLYILKSFSEYIVEIYLLLLFFSFFLVFLDLDLEHELPK